jgi:hypothetical protein
LGVTGQGPDIAKGKSAGGVAAEPGLSLLFAAGCRPALADVSALAEGRREPVDLPAGFAIGHQPPEQEGWVELLVSGLSFYLAGLLPAPPTAPPPRRHGLGLDGPELPEDLEAVRIMPAPHIIAGAALPPVVRTMTVLAAAMTQLGNVRAVCWHPAGTMIEPRLFVRLIEAWLAGGAFPALGLTALIADDDGGVRSDGLAFFTGQELRIEPDANLQPGEARKHAVRVIHRLVEDGQIVSVWELPGHDGSLLEVEPSLDGRLLRIWRRS